MTRRDPRTDPRECDVLYQAKRISIKPCPFPSCGRRDKSTIEGRAPAFFVVCRACGLTGPYGSTRDKAVELFNEIPRKEKQDGTKAKKL